MGFKNILLFLSAMMVSSVAYAGSGPGTAGLQFLNNDYSPRALGMGGAYVSVAEGVDAIDYNPAGLGQIKYPEFSAAYHSGIDDSYSGSVKFGFLLPQIGFARYARPAVAFSVISSNAGDMTVRLLDSNNTPSLEKKINAEQDYSISVSYAEKFFVGDIILEKLRFEDIEQYYGVNIKYLRSTLVDEYTGNGAGIDIGYLLKHNRSRISFGFALSNLGTGIKYIEETEKMPTTAKAGLSWMMPTLYDQKIRLAYQGDFHIGENYFVSRFGAEYLFDKYVEVRIGYIDSEDNPSFAVGASLKYDDLSFDISATTGDIYNVTMASINYRFSGLAYKTSAIKKKKFRGVEKEVADPVGSKKKTPYSQEAEPQKKEVADPVMIPAKKEKSTGDAGLFLIY